MSVKARLGFGAASALPFLAPYALLIQPAWSDFLSIAGLFAVVVSIGAVAVSMLLLLVALFGLNRSVEFNVGARTIQVTESHLLQRQREFSYSFAEVNQIEVVGHDWSDSPSTYEIRLTPVAGKPLSFGVFPKRADAEFVVSSLNALIEG